MIYIFIIISVFFTSTHAQTMYINPQFSSVIAAKEYFNQERPVFLWDLHGVLFLQAPLKLIKTSLFSESHVFSCPLQTLKALISYQNWQHMNNEFSKGTVIYDAYCETFKKYPDLYRLLIQYANHLYTPNDRVFPIIKKLYSHDYDHYLFSNIGPVVLNNLRTHHTIPFTHFKNSGNNLINNTLPTNTTLWLSKSESSAYVTAMDNIKKEPHQIIFIDDSKSKIEKAHSMGWNCILYQNPEQLFRDIRSLITL